MSSWKGAGLRQTVLSGARWTLASRVGLQLVTWPVTIVVMRLLEPGDYGVFAIAMLVHGFITLFSELGLGIALVQAAEVSERQARMAASIVLVLNTAVAVTIVLVAPRVARQYDAPAVAAVMWALTAELVVGALAAVPTAMLERALRFREIGVAQIASGVAGALVTLGAALGGFGVWALVAGALGQALVRCGCIVFAYGRIVPPGPVDLHGIRPMVKVSGHTMVGRLLWYWSGQADTLILGLRLQAAALGAYSTAAQLAMLPAGKAMEAVNRVAFPVLCRLREDMPALRRTVARLRALLALYAFGVCWGLAAVAPEFVLLILGEKWASAQLPLAALALVAPLRMLCAFNNTVATAIGAPEAATRDLIVASVLVPGAIAIGAASHGLDGAALAWLVAYPVVFLVSTGLTSRAIVERWTDAFAPLAAPVASGLAMLACVAGCRALASGSIPLALLLPAEILLGAAVYLLVLRIAARPLLDDTRALVIDLVRPGRTA